MRLDGGFHLFHVMELLEGARNLLEVVAYKPYLIVAGLFQITHNLTVLFVTLITQLTHLPENGHLPVGLNQTEVLQGCLHRGGIGVVGIYNEVVLLCDGHLTPVV